MTSNILRAVAGLTLLAMLAAAPDARAAIVFDSNNGDSVTVGNPPDPTTFTLTQRSYITLLDVYMFGDSTSSIFTLDILNASNGVVSTSVASIGTYFTNPLDDSVNLSNVLITPSFPHFQSAPDVWLNAGTYTITNSGQSTWSWNGASEDEGFAAVGTGVPVPEPTSMALLGVGLMTVGIRRRFRRAWSPALPDHTHREAKPLETPVR